MKSRATGYTDYYKKNTNGATEDDDEMSETIIPRGATPKKTSLTDLNSDTSGSLKKEVADNPMARRKAAIKRRMAKLKAGS